MTIELNHTIVPARDKRASAKFLADILGLEAGPEWSHFVPVRTSNGVTLDYPDATDFGRQHYAFLVSEQEFDAALSRIKGAGAAFYADFNRDGRGQINHLYGGRGFLFRRPRRPSDGNHHPPQRPDSRTVDRTAVLTRDQSTMLTGLLSRLPGSRARPVPRNGDPRRRASDANRRQHRAAPEKIVSAAIKVCRRR